MAQAQRDFLFFAIDAQNHCLDFLFLLKDVGRFGDPFGPGQFGNVNETFNAFLEFHERAVRDEVRDLAFDVLTRRKPLFDLVPRILLGLLQA